ncbi:hypothetical protein [Rossellomorea sp. YZS02]|nr:hypothetical protein [Rossellomorea sp. YZS02]MDX8342443.1 hypothetical protein [Rossellomorea sp. YZS02]
MFNVYKEEMILILKRKEMQEFVDLYQTKPAAPIINKKESICCSPCCPVV